MNRFSFQCRHRFASGFSLDVAFETTAPVTALVGASGAGKTSVLYHVAGLLRPEHGRIAMGESVWLDTQTRRCVPPQERQVGFVLQDHQLFPHMSVERNLTYGHRRRGRTGTIEPRRVIQVLELGDLLARYPRNLSGGEKQRVALGRALLSGPRLLLLDEPLAALDEPLKQRILEYFERVMSEWHVPTIYVSHNAEEVRRLAEYVIVLAGGRIDRCGEPRHVLPQTYAGDYSYPREK